LLGVARLDDGSARGIATAAAMTVAPPPPLVAGRPTVRMKVSAVIAKAAMLEAARGVGGR
jgi:hypothetical protein